MLVYDVLNYWQFKNERLSQYNQQVEIFFRWKWHVRYISETQVLSSKINVLKSYQRFVDITKY